MSNEELVIQIKAGVRVAENMGQLYEQTRKFIHSIAQKYKNYETIEDLEQEGYLALYDAIDGFEQAKGYKFLTYAEHWIKQRIQRYIQKNSCCLRVSFHTYERIIKWKKFLENFQKEYGREPVEEEACYYLGLSGKQFQTLQKDITNMNLESLDRPAGLEEENILLGDTVADFRNMEEDVIECITKNQFRTELWNIVDELGEGPATIIRTRYLQGLSLRATGELYGITVERVRQQESKALRELRKPKNRKRIEPYLEDYITTHAFSCNGIEHFNRTWTSSTEYTAMKLIEM